jgi:hypothetical protein
LVEIDETYVGGKPRKDNSGRNANPGGKRGRGTKKTPVVAVIERDTKKVHAKVALPDKDGKKLTGCNRKITLHRKWQIGVLSFW